MATRCSTNPPLCLTARYTSIAFQRCSQLSFAVAMIIRSIHFRWCAMRIRAIPSPFQRKTALRVSVADQRISLLFPCFAMRCPASRLIAFAARLEAPPSLALAFLYAATLYFAIPSRYIAGRVHAIAFPGASRRLISMPSHRVSLLLNTSPSLSKTCLSHSISALRQSPLFLCVAEIRIAPQSLCCSSGSKTELSLPYAVLNCAALHLSAAVLFNSLPFLCNAPLCSAVQV